MLKVFLSSEIEDWNGASSVLQKNGEGDGEGDRI